MNQKKKMHDKRSMVFEGLKILLNSPESPLHPEHRAKIESAPTKQLVAAAQGKTKKKDEDKERSKARIAALQQ